jgi:hypothetical protein
LSNARIPQSAFSLAMRHHAASRLSLESHKGFGGGPDDCAIHAPNSVDRTNNQSFYGCQFSPHIADGYGIATRTLRNNDALTFEDSF